MIPTIQFTPHERLAQAIQMETLEQATKLFRANGCLLLENVFPQALITELYAAYFTRYHRYFRADKYPDALTVGDKRYQVTVDFEPPFNTPLLYAHPLMLSIFRSLLGEDCVLGSFASVASLPGSSVQHVHRDGVALFPNVPGKMIPSYAITLVIPLVALNDLHGTTRIWPGTHRQDGEVSPNSDCVEPRVPLGSCFLMDYRVQHQGTENYSMQVRPLLYLVYHHYLRQLQQYD